MKHVLAFPLLLAVVVAGLAAGPALAQPLFTSSLSANGIWFHADEDPYPSDFEVGANVAASLTPHVSLVGGAFYGVAHSYVRAVVGPRVTATNVDDPNFSVGLGAGYHLSSEETIRPQEWAADASVGWVPWPARNPNLLLVVLGTYGLESNQASGLLGVRYVLGGRQ